MESKCVSAYVAACVTHMPVKIQNVLSMGQKSPHCPPLPTAARWLWPMSVEMDPRGLFSNFTHCSVRSLALSISGPVAWLSDLAVSWAFRLLTEQECTGRLSPSFSQQRETLPTFPQEVSASEHPSSGYPAWAPSTLIWGRPPSSLTSPSSPLCIPLGM